MFFFGSNVYSWCTVIEDQLILCVFSCKQVKSSSEWVWCELDAIKINFKYGCKHIYRCKVSILRYEWYTARITRYHIVPWLYVKIVVFVMILSYNTCKTQKYKLLFGNVSFCTQCIGFEDRPLMLIKTLRSIILIEPQKD